MNVVMAVLQLFPYSGFVLGWFDNLSQDAAMT